MQRLRSRSIHLVLHHHMGPEPLPVLRSQPLMPGKCEPPMQCSQLSGFRRECNAAAEQNHGGYLQ